MIQVWTKLFKGYLPQILLGPLVNTFSQLFIRKLNKRQVSVKWLDFEKIFHDNGICNHSELPNSSSVIYFCVLNGFSGGVTKNLDKLFWKISQNPRESICVGVLLKLFNKVSTYNLRLNSAHDATIMSISPSQLIFQLQNDWKLRFEPIILDNRRQNDTSSPLSTKNRFQKKLHD